MDFAKGMIFEAKIQVKKSSSSSIIHSTNNAISNICLGQRIRSQLAALVLGQQATTLSKENGDLLWGAPLNAKTTYDYLTSVYAEQIKLVEY